MGRRRMTTSEFVERARKIHGLSYDYSKTQFDRTDRLVQILCSVHGYFSQTASNHLQGYGCKQCSIERRRKTTKEFIKDAQDTHGDRYGYSQTKYVNDSTKVIIECSTHGFFKARPSKHVGGTGCPKCANKNVTTEEFISKCQAVHGDNYDYSRVEYSPGYSKVEIVCPKHGSFFQVTYNHLSNKQGCPECKLEQTRQNVGLYGEALFISRPESRNMIVWLYLLYCKSDNEHFYKVGITRNVQSRVYSIPYAVDVIYKIELCLGDAFKKEQTIKSSFIKYKPSKKFSGWTECLTLTTNDLYETEMIFRG